MRVQHLPVKILNGVGCRTHVGCPSLSQQEDAVNQRKKKMTNEPFIELYASILKTKFPSA